MQHPNGIHTTGKAPLEWFLVYESGEEYDSLTGSWNNISEYYTEGDENTGVITYPLTTMNVARLYIHSGNGSLVYEIMPPEPCPFFSFARYGVALPTELTTSTPHTPVTYWLYSLFGFFFGDYRFTWKISPQGCITTSITSRAQPLSL